jgi:ABC-type sulfate/molybdate transport systems ATPase subunit
MNCKRFRFSQYENTLVSHLSGGAKQKLNLALALLHSPDVLILDELFRIRLETIHFWQCYLRSRLGRVINNYASCFSA